MVVATACRARATAILDGVGGCARSRAARMAAPAMARALPGSAAATLDTRAPTVRSTSTVASVRMAAQRVVCAQTACARAMSATGKSSRAGSITHITSLPSHPLPPLHFFPYRGIDCSTAPGQCLSNCSGRGTCVDGRCKCKPGYEGESCNVRLLAYICPNDCSDVGVCQKGQCFCPPGYKGEDCSIRTCENDCSAHGVCVHGQCRCYTGWGGAACDGKQRAAALSPRTHRAALTTHLSPLTSHLFSPLTTHHSLPPSPCPCRPR